MTTTVPVRRRGYTPLGYPAVYERFARKELLKDPFFRALNQDEQKAEVQRRCLERWEKNGGKPEGDKASRAQSKDRSEDDIECEGGELSVPTFVGRIGKVNIEVGADTYCLKVVVDGQTSYVSDLNSIPAVVFKQLVRLKVRDASVISDLKELGLLIKEAAREVSECFSETSFAAT